MSKEKKQIDCSFKLPLENQETEEQRTTDEEEYKKKIPLFICKVQTKDF